MLFCPGSTIKSPYSTICIYLSFNSSSSAEEDRRASYSVRNPSAYSSSHPRDSGWKHCRHDLRENRLDGAAHPDPVINLPEEKEVIILETDSYSSGCDRVRSCGNSCGICHYCLIYSSSAIRLNYYFNFSVCGIPESSSRSPS